MLRLTLSDRLVEPIQKKFDEGPYSSVEAVISEALFLLDHRDERVAALRRDIQEGLGSGRGRKFDDAVVEDIKMRGRERLV